MIESITINGVSTFSQPVTLDGLSDFNFLYGSNGTGKTTISRVIANLEDYPLCSINWKAGNKIQTLVYNSDFIDGNFNQQSELKGVFTLGENNIELISQINSAKQELEGIEYEIERLRQTLNGEDGKGGKTGELIDLETSFKNQCWEQKQKHDEKLKGGFTGFRDDKVKFKRKVIEESSSNNASLLPLEELEKNAETLFDSKPGMESRFPLINSTKLLNYESDSILRKKVIGKQDVDIANMIIKLNNSDWVHQGSKFYKENDSICPFCQQKTNEAFARSLNDYFDETYTNDLREIDSLVTNYAKEAITIQQQLKSIIESKSKFININELTAKVEILDTKITLNNNHLAEKKTEASSLIELESLSTVLDEISNIIKDANTKIDSHNNLIADLRSAQNSLISQIWRFILEELKKEIEHYNTTKINLNKAIGSITEKKRKYEAEKVQKQAYINELERNITSTEPTVTEINKILYNFGFEGFKLSTNETKTSYTLVRSDGTDAKSTLSEGEKTFVTFLYFYHLLKGSDSESGITTNRIVVIDDPVSSLDSDILFVVSSLIKKLFEDVRNDTGNIKQIFILTHNIYFHKEVTFNPDREGSKKMSDETFWLVRKPRHTSQIEKHSSNPIKTSYELLWAEVRRFDRSNLSIQNTLRRILENYFKILGGINFYKLSEKFEGNDKIFYNSLCSWVNDGSHYAHDDLYVAVDETMVEHYLKIFRDIFLKSGHFSHYKMMMGNDFEEEFGGEGELPQLSEEKTLGE